MARVKRNNSYAVTIEEAVDKIKQGSRRYAKRQLTWFRRERDVIWIDKDKLDYDNEKILQEMLKNIRERTKIEC